MLTMALGPVRNTGGGGLGGPLSKKRTERRKEISCGAETAGEPGPVRARGCGWTGRPGGHPVRVLQTQGAAVAWAAPCSPGGPRAEGPRGPALDPEAPSHSP